MILESKSASAAGLGDLPLPSGLAKEAPLLGSLEHPGHNSIIILFVESYFAFDCNLMLERDSNKFFVSFASRTVLGT